MKLRLGAHFAGVIFLAIAPMLSAASELLPGHLVNIQGLGRALFFDASLSRKADVSCASCHQPKHAFSDGRPVAVGTGHQTGTRNTPSLLALGAAGPFFWDGRTEQLEQVMAQPFTNAVEMGLVSQDELLDHLRKNRGYVSAFSKAFPESPTPITIEHLQRVLAAYVRTLGHGTNAYDRFASDQNALSAEAKHGLMLFQGSAGCAECHRMEGSRAGFTDDAFHSTQINGKLAPMLPATAIQLSQSSPDVLMLGVVIESDAKVSELGRYVVTHDPKDIGAFRTPSLRNVASTAPYMHDGSANTLREAVDREIYYRNLQSNRPNTLTEQDRQDLVTFLKSLTE